MGDERIRVRGDRDLRRRRLAVLFRALIGLPHYVIVLGWTALIAIVLPVSWLSALLTGRVPQPLHRHLAAYLRYLGQVCAWLDLLSGRFPRLRRPREHPFDVEVPAPQRQRRVVTLLRVPLAVPATILSSVFGVILVTVGFASWFVALVLGRTTAGLQELGTFCLRYQLGAGLRLATDVGLSETRAGAGSDATRYSRARMTSSCSGKRCSRCLLKSSFPSAVTSN